MVRQLLAGALDAPRFGGEPPDGVDRAQIRRMLALTPRERIRHMADVANGMARIHARATASCMTFDPEHLLQVLNRHRVSYVIVGGLAAVAHGSTLPTEDVDVTPTRDRDNLDRLAAALREVGARLRTEHEPAGVEFPCDGEFLSANSSILNLVTDLGDIDLVIAPAGFPRGYDDLVGQAMVIDLGDGLVTHIAALEDVITSRRAAGRAKDLAALPYLDALVRDLNAKRTTDACRDQVCVATERVCDAVCPPVPWAVSW